MTARTDRIAKLTGLIAECEVRNLPNKASKFTDLRARFEGWEDHHYDYQMALAAWCLENKDGDTQAFYRAYYTKAA